MLAQQRSHHLGTLCRYRTTWAATVGIIGLGKIGAGNRAGSRRRWGMTVLGVKTALSRGITTRNRFNLDALYSPARPPHGAGAIRVFVLVAARTPTKDRAHDWHHRVRDASAWARVSSTLAGGILVDEPAMIAALKSWPDRKCPCWTSSAKEPLAPDSVFWDMPNVPHQSPLRQHERIAENARVTDLFLPEFTTVSGRVNQ